MSSQRWWGYWVRDPQNPWPVHATSSCHKAPHPAGGLALHSHHPAGTGPGLEPSLQATHHSYPRQPQLLGSCRTQEGAMGQAGRAAASRSQAMEAAGPPVPFCSGMDANLQDSTGASWAWTAQDAGAEQRLTEAQVPAQPPVPTALATRTPTSSSEGASWGGGALPLTGAAPCRRDGLDASAVQRLWPDSGSPTQEKASLPECRGTLPHSGHPASWSCRVAHTPVRPISMRATRRDGSGPWHAGGGLLRGDKWQHKAQVSPAPGPPLHRPATPWAHSLRQDHGSLTQCWGYCSMQANACAQPITCRAPWGPSGQS